jgi:hypothetical protein
MVSSVPGVFNTLAATSKWICVFHSRVFDKPPPIVLLIFDGHAVRYEGGGIIHALEPIDAANVGPVF